MHPILSQLPSALLPWYQAGHRDLPWRADREPYHIWLSEIMLQQTRVEAVKGYYARFLAALPTVEALADCDDDALHKLWEGLGYYSRVRNLKKAAQCIHPNTAAASPGSTKPFGPYQASATIPPGRFALLPIICLPQRWTEMFCGWFPGC